MVDIGFRVTAGHLPPVLVNMPAMFEAVAELQNRTMQSIVTKGKVYPPPPGRLPPTQQRGRNGKLTTRKVHQYKRTFILRNSWHITPAHVSGDTIRGAVSNNATDKYGNHYASRVFGSTDFDQAPIHQGRWPTRDDLFDRGAYNTELRAILSGG